MARQNVRTLMNTLFLAAAMLALAGTSLVAAVAGESGNNDLVIADGGATKATVVVSPQAGEWEKQAAADLVTFIEMMSGAKPTLANTAEAAAAAMGGQQDPVIVIGQAALAADPSLREALNKVAKQKPVLRADAIVLRRAGNRVYLAGTNDSSHYYAESGPRQRWGCRWYMPTDFGQVVPSDPTLKVGTLDYSYGPPFEVRKYWLSWIGDTTGQ